MEHDTSESPPRRRPAPRLYHKKSRLGCLRCKGRRVKCDERRPTCSGCARHDVACVYPVGVGGPVRESGSASGSTQERGDSGSDRGVEISERPKRKRPDPRPSGYTLDESSPDNESTEDNNTLPESRDRRMTELRLLHHYLIAQSRTFGQKLGTTPPTGYVWSSDLVSRALASDGADGDGILYALIAHAALGVWMRINPADADAQQQIQHHRHLHQQYLSMALRAQRRAVDWLVEADSSTPSPENTKLADNVGSAALLLVNHSFALVQTLPLEPWQPPHEWLHMGRGAMHVMDVAQDFLEFSSSTSSSKTSVSRASRTAKSRSTVVRALTTPVTDSSNSLVLRIVHSPPHFDPADMFAAVWAAPYLHLLDEPDAPAAADEPEIDERQHFAQSVPGLYDPEAKEMSDMDVYYETLAYIGWCAAAAQRPDEPLNAVCRRFAAAAYWFSEELEARLDERRPRALVCLAQFFALWIPFEFSPEVSDPQKQTKYPIWMMGTAGRRQVAAIHGALPTRWKSKVAPLLES